MTPRQARLAFLVPLLVLVTLALPSAAYAHRLNFDSDPNRPLYDYIWLGALHMLTGWDHLLFIIGVVLLAGSMRTAAKLVSLFVLGHSLTLLVATLAGWQLNATVVDIIIAFSVIYVGVQGWFGRPKDWRLFGAVVFAFGLVHGLGLSTRLQELGLPEDGLVPRILLFNLGIELGQLSVLTLVVGVLALLRRRVQWRPAAAQPVAFSGLVAAGFLAAVLLALSPPEKAEATSVEGSQTCTEAEVSLTLTGAGGHPPKDFYGPDEEAPRIDVLHVIGDGFVAVWYAPSLPAEDVEALKTWVQKDDKAVVGAPDPEQTVPIRAVTARRELTCSELEVEALTTFRNSWFDSVDIDAG